MYNLAFRGYFLFTRCHARSRSQQLILFSLDVVSALLSATLLRTCRRFRDHRLGGVVRLRSAAGFAPPVRVSRFSLHCLDPGLRIRHGAALPTPRREQIKIPFLPERCRSCGPDHMVCRLPFRRFAEVSYARAG